MGATGTINTRGNQSIVLFDGVCNLCSGAVLFIIKRDRQAKFLFASLQSRFGQQQLKKLGLERDTFQTIILIRGADVFYRSNAALEIARGLSGLWPSLYLLKIIPAFIRDALYNYISRNRYKFFGKKDVCMIPTPELQSRFIIEDNGLLN